MAAGTINEGPVTTFYGFLDDATAGVLAGSPGLDRTKVPIHFAASNAKFARFNVSVATTNTIDTKIGTNNGCRVLAFALAPDYDDSSPQGTVTFGAGVTVSAFDWATGIFTFAVQSSTRTLNLLIWYV